jgi:hypothetical protein
MLPFYSVAAFCNIIIISKAFYKAAKNSARATSGYYMVLPPVNQVDSEEHSKTRQYLLNGFIAFNFCFKFL